MSKIFVFGSNLAGIHGAGAALDAVRNYGAVMYQGEGLQGNSYALPTKDERIHTLPIHSVRYYVNRFLDFAEQHPELQFKVTQVGCGLAGLRATDIAPMFLDAPSNCWFDEAWTLILGFKDKDLNNRNYWGTR